VPAAAVLVGEAAVDGVAGVERLALEICRRDQPVVDRAGREASFDLRREAAPFTSRPVLFDFGEEIAIGRSKK
jgi:hypothetical protein